MQGTVGGIGLLKGISPITINMIDMVSKQGTISFEYIFFFWFGVFWLVILQVTGYSPSDFWPNVMQGP